MRARSHLVMLAWLMVGSGVVVSVQAAYTKGVKSLHVTLQSVRPYQHDTCSTSVLEKCHM